MSSKSDYKGWRSIYPDAIRDDRVFMAFINAGLEPPNDDRVKTRGYETNERKVLDTLITSIADQGLDA